MASFEDYTDIETGDKHSVVLFNSIKYQFDDGTTAEVVPAAAWCFDCDRLGVSEHLDGQQEIEGTRMKLRSIIDGSKEYVSHFFWPDSPTRADAESKLAKLESCWTRFRSRESPERWLRCGGTNIQKTNSCLGESTAIRGGPILKCTASGVADIGIEPQVFLNVEGENVNGGGAR